MKASTKKKTMNTVAQDDEIIDPTEVIGEEVSEVVAPTLPADPSDEHLTVDDAVLGEITIEQPKNVQVDVSQLRKNDQVIVTMHESIEPAPVVGTFNVGARLNVRKLEARRTYRLPKYVALVLVEAKKAEYVQID